jgi:cytochrome c oxidase subunit 4
MTRVTVAFGGLFALTALTFALSFVALGPAEVPVALGIAAAKALLVAAFFMELVDERFGTRIVMLVAVAMVILLAGFAAADVATRAAG